MPRLQPIERNTPTEVTQQLLADVEDQLGMVPNHIATMAQSNWVARAYLAMTEALADGLLEEPLPEQIALTVSQANGCDYCISGHSAIGNFIGLTNDEVRDARKDTLPDRKTEAALGFARRIVEQRGAVSDDDINAIRIAGYSEPEIVEMIAHVALNTFSNYFNLDAQTEIDIPPVAELDP